VCACMHACVCVHVRVCACMHACVWYNMVHWISPGCTMCALIQSYYSPGCTMCALIQSYYCPGCTMCALIQSYYCPGLYNVCTDPIILLSWAVQCVHWSNPTTVLAVWYYSLCFLAVTNHNDTNPNQLQSTCRVIYKSNNNTILS